ncbi:MAG: hypothetical protein HQ518_04220 [Rhodopirellula sp.]|nr:hypothetical protein [Rhodopirellula sp.]
MREVVRRIVAAVCLYGGITLCLTQGRGLYQVEPIDWQREAYDRQQQSQRMLGMMSRYTGPEAVEGVDLASNTRGLLQEYIQSETENRLISVSGDTWAGLWSDTVATLEDRPPSSAWQSRRGLDHRSDTLYFRTEEGPLSELARQWPEGSTLVYVRIDPAAGTDATPQYLSVMRCSAYDVRDGAPGHIAYPYRTYGAGLLLAGLLVYLFLPRRARPEQGIFYQARAAGWLPDLLAAGGSGVFFALPFLITSDSDGGPFSADWWPLTLIMCLFAAMFGSIFVITTWYQTRRLTWDDNGIRVQTWGQSEHFYARDELQSVGPFVWEAPRWLRALAWIISIFNWRATTSAILLDRSDPGLRLALTNDRSFCFTGDGLYGAASFLKWLDRQHVPVDADVRELMAAHSDYQPSRAGFVAGLIFGVGALVGAGWPLISIAADYWPQPAPEFHAGRIAPATPFVRPIPARPTITPEVLARESAIMAEMQKVRDELQSVRDEIHIGMPKDSEPMRKFQAAMDRLKVLQTEFDAVRKGEQPADTEPEPEPEPEPGSKNQPATGQPVDTTD